MSPLAVLAAGLAGAAGWLAVSYLPGSGAVGAPRWSSAVLLQRWASAGLRRVTAVRRRSPRLAALELLDAVVAELRAGASPAVALARAGPAAGVVPRALAAVRIGADVPMALRGDADVVGAPVLRAFGACWQVAEGSGARLADALDRLVVSARSAERLRGELAAALAEPRATARVLALLPMFGLLLGTGLGVDPVGWLVGSGPGRLVLAAGLVLQAFGVWWSRRISRSVERLL